MEIRSEHFDADKIPRDIRTLSEPEEEYHKPIKIVNAFDDNYIGYESNEDKDKMVSIEKYLDKIEPYLNDLIDDDLETQGKWKIQLTMTINFISSEEFC